MREIGAFTQYIDVTQVVLYVFWIFFVLLVLYLHRESKREGYPLRSDRSDNITVQGYPSVPEAKTYKLFHGGETQLPNNRNDDGRQLAAMDGRAAGDPIIPTGNPMIDGLGPAAWADRADVPDQNLHGGPRIVPMAKLSSDDYQLEAKSIDPRGLRVVAADGEAVGQVSDIWLDIMEFLPRYYQVELHSGKTVLLPVMLSKIIKSKVAPADGDLATRMDTRERLVRVVSIFSHQFDDVPTTASDAQVTLLEEDKISAYYGGGHLYASPERAEPFL